MKNLLSKITYQDFIFYVLTVSLFYVFLMPFTTYVSLHLIPDPSGSVNHYMNDTRTTNINLFKDRNYIFYYVMCVASIMILLHRDTVYSIVNMFNDFSKTIRVSIVIFFALGFLSAVFAISPSIAFKGVSITLMQFLCVLFVANYIRNRQFSIEVFYRVILLSIILFVGMLFLQLSLSNFSIYGDIVAGNIQQGLLSRYNTLNPRFLDNYFSWFIPLLVLPWLCNYRQIYKLGSFVALSLLWFVVINRGSRAIFVEYLVILPLMYIYARQYFKTFFIIIIITLIMGIIVNFGYKELIMVGGLDSINEIQRYGSSGRIYLWKEAFNVGLSHPLLGVGQWNYIAVAQVAANNYPHNLLLEIWSQWGIPAFIAAVVVMYTCVKNIFVNRASIVINPIYLIFITMLLAGMIDGMVSAMFKTSLGLFGCVFVFGFALSIFTQHKGTFVDVESYSKVIHIGLGVLVSACVSCVVILPLIFQPIWL